MGEVITFEEVQNKVIKKYMDLFLGHILDDLRPISKITKNEEAIQFLESKLPDTKGLSFEIKMSIFLSTIALVDKLNT